jgi:hypothetical protein
MQVFEMSTVPFVSVLQGDWLRLFLDRTTILQSWKRKAGREKYMHCIYGSDCCTQQEWSVSLTTILLERRVSTHNARWMQGQWTSELQGPQHRYCKEARAVADADRRAIRLVHRLDAATLCVWIVGRVSLRPRHVPKSHHAVVSCGLRRRVGFGICIRRQRSYSGWQNGVPEVAFQIMEMSQLV